MLNIHNEYYQVLNRNTSLYQYIFHIMFSYPYQFFPGYIFHSGPDCSLVQAMDVIQVFIDI